MGQASKIEWTHHTWNSWRGCTKDSEGCANCYAEAMSNINHTNLGYWGKNGNRVPTKEKNWHDLEEWNDWAAAGVCHQCGGRGTVVENKVRVTCPNCDGSSLEGDGAPYKARVFCHSFSDVFEGQDTMPERNWPMVVAGQAKLLRHIHRLPHLNFLLLTKRPQNAMPALERAALGCERSSPFNAWLNDWIAGGPPENVALGVSVENQRNDWRIVELMKLPARTRFLSCEPLIGPLDFRLVPGFNKHPSRMAEALKSLWVIAGGESGWDARPMNPAWPRMLRDQCRAAGVPFFFKQWGTWGPEHADGQETGDGVFLPDGRFIDPYELDAPNAPKVDVATLPHMYRVGKKTSGRLLDGVTFSEFPESLSQTAAA